MLSALVRLPESDGPLVHRFSSTTSESRKRSLARIPGGAWLIVTSVRPRFARRLPNTFGWLSKRPIEPRVMDAFLAPALRDGRIRGRLQAFLRGIEKRYTLEAAEQFRSFEKPVLVAWANDDRIFRLRDAKRLAAAFPDARLELIDGSRAFVSIDQPKRTAELIRAFAREPVRHRATVRQPEPGVRER